MKRDFVKMHGLGNDFAIFDGRTSAWLPTDGQIRTLGDRHRGIGFDQMVIMDPPKTAGTEIFFRIFNTDGSEVSSCGNVTRCIAWLLAQENGRKAFAMETRAGRLEATVKDAGEITVDMGAARLSWQEIPLSHEENTLCLAVSAGELENPVAVSMGNPHAVFFVPDAEAVDLARLGPQVEHHPLFPERVNVEVAQILENDIIRMRVWERGAGITQACGTGACATAVAAVRRRLAPRSVTVRLDGGDLHIEWRESDGHVLMTGAATYVYSGTLDH